MNFNIHLVNKPSVTYVSVTVAINSYSPLIWWAVTVLVSVLDKEILTIRCWHLPIFPGRRQPSIFGTTGLNFRVREMWSPKSPAFWRKDE